jgi:signal transduction histidine kinase
MLGHTPAGVMEKGLMQTQATRTRLEQILLDLTVADSARTACFRHWDDRYLQLSDSASRGLPRDNGGKDTLDVGIACMRERVRQFGGQLEVSSSHHGTAARAILPLGGDA